MSTRSRIGIEGEDGRVRSVYCHSDGYLSYNGAQLLAHYNDAERALALINEGDLSFLNGPELAPVGTRDGGTVSYKRWRNEEGVDPREDTSRDTFRCDDDWDIEYFYLYGPRGWEYATNRTDPFAPLTLAATVEG